MDEDKEGSGVKEATAKAGTLLAISRGCYSNYEIQGFFVVLKDFDPMAEITKWHATAPCNEYGNPDLDAFLPSLIASGVILEIQYGEFHTVDYGDVEEAWFQPIGTSRFDD